MTTVTGNTGQGALWGSVGWPQVGEGAAWVMTVTGNKKVRKPGVEVFGAHRLVKRQFG